MRRGGTWAGCAAALVAAMAVVSLFDVGCGVDGVTPDCTNTPECGPIGLADAAPFDSGEAGDAGPDVVVEGGLLFADAGDPDAADGS